MMELYTHCMYASSSRIHNYLKNCQDFYKKHAQVWMVIKIASEYAAKIYMCIMNIIRIK